MEVFSKIIDLFIHLDKNLILVIQQYGAFTYLLLFLIIFLETGLVVTPFLPGDSLIFAAGTFAGSQLLHIWILYPLLCVGAILGDTINYWIGHFLGPKVFQKKNSRIFKREYLIKTHTFYEKYGGKTIIIARFMPILRTFAPFVAGIGKMHYKTFISYNIIGGIVWVTLFSFAGYFFGKLPIIKNNFHYAIFIIIFLSILPGIFEYIKYKGQKKEKSSLDTDYQSLEKTFHNKHISD